MLNFEAAGLGPNVYFSRAGRYDKKHKGTYGDKRGLEVLKYILGWGLPSKYQVSAGYANIGHTDGRGGEHVNNAIDIGLSGWNNQQINAWREMAKKKGLKEGEHYLYEGAGTPNNHFHLRPWLIEPLLKRAQPTNIPNNAFEPKLPQVANLAQSVNLPQQVTAPKINNPALEQQATQSLIDGQWFTPQQWDNFAAMSASNSPKPTINFNDTGLKMNQALNQAHSSNPQQNDYNYLGWAMDGGIDGNGVGIGEGGLHYTDKFKLPNHSSFSNESIYATGDNARLAGQWDNGAENPYFNSAIYSPSFDGFMAGKMPRREVWNESPDLQVKKSLFSEIMKLKGL